MGGATSNAFQSTKSANRNKAEIAAADEAMRKAMLPPPPEADTTDAAVRAAREAQTSRLLMGRGRKSSFLTGGSGAGLANKPRTLLGGG